MFTTVTDNPFKVSQDHRMVNETDPGEGNSVNRIHKSDHEVVCSECGGHIHSSARVEVEHVCLICHARMLNDYFHNLRKRSDEKRNTSRVASE